MSTTIAAALLALAIFVGQSTVPRPVEPATDANMSVQVNWDPIVTMQSRIPGRCAWVSCGNLIMGCDNVVFDKRQCEDLRGVGVVQ